MRTHCHSIAETLCYWFRACWCPCRNQHQTWLDWLKLPRKGLVVGGLGTGHAESESSSVLAGVGWITPKACSKHCLVEGEENVSVLLTERNLPQLNCQRWEKQGTGPFVNVSFSVTRAVITICLVSALMASFWRAGWLTLFPGPAAPLGSVAGFHLLHEESTARWEHRASSPQSTYSEYIWQPNSRDKCVRSVFWTIFRLYKCSSHFSRSQLEKCPCFCFFFFNATMLFGTDVPNIKLYQVNMHIFIYISTTYL